MREAISTMAAAEECGVHYTTIRRWILDGSLPAYETPGGHLRILRKDLSQFIESRKLRGKRAVTGTLRILIVDDDDTFRESAAEFFGRAPDTEIRSAGDGFTAGRLVAEFQPHVVVLDLLMPGMNGFDVCLSIRSAPRTRGAIVIVLTGFPTDENIRRARECGADLCLAKPISLDELRDKVLEMGRGNDEGRAPQR